MSELVFLIVFIVVVGGFLTTMLEALWP